MNTSAQNGKIAEVLVELELLKRGWHVERLDGAAKAANGDLIAIKGNLRHIIQVKSALTWSRPSFGHATGFLKDGISFFNSKPSPVQADYLVTVVSGADQPLFHVFPIDEAEKLAQLLAVKWRDKPKRDGGKRSINFPVSAHQDDPLLVPFYSNWESLEA